MGRSETVEIKMSDGTATNAEVAVRDSTIDIAAGRTLRPDEAKDSITPLARRQSPQSEFPPKALMSADFAANCC